FNAGLAAILIAVAFFFRSVETETTLGTVAFRALVISEAAVVVYWATIGRTLARIRPAIVALSCVSGLVAVVAQAIDTAAAGAAATAATKALTVASFLSSSALLGGACTAMI